MPDGPGQVPSRLPPRVLPGSQSRSLADRAAALADLVGPRPDEAAYASLFTGRLLARHPAPELTRLLQGLHDRVGRCVHVEVVSARAVRLGVVEYLFERGHRVEASVALDGGDPPRVASFTFGAPQFVAQGNEGVLEAVRELPGRAALLLTPLPGPALIHVHAGMPLAIGSAFKLWVLCELFRSIEAGERRWSDVVPVQERHRSRATGLLHRWPAEAPVTLHTLASLMVGLSDNTAADHLLEVLGPDRILAMMEQTGHEAVARNVPLLSTLEMARLKGEPSGAWAPRYAEATLAERRRILAELADLALGDLSIPGHPQHIDHLEWFASAGDLCRALDWFRLRTEAGADGMVARDILAMNGGLELSARDWSYVGFKGGGEEGVLCAAYLLRRRRDGAWFALAATWNDPGGATDEGRFLSLVRDALHLAARSEVRSPAGS